MDNQFTFKAETMPNLITFNNPKPVAKITPDGIMHFTVDASDENAKRFIECIDSMLTQMGRGKLQAVSAESDERFESRGPREFALHWDRPRRGLPCIQLFVGVQCEEPMIEIRWVGRQLQFRQRAFQADAAGAFCGVTDFDDWQTVPEQEIDEATIQERDEAEHAADRLASLILGEDIDWPCHDDAWKRAIEKLEPSVRPVAAALPCEHCGRDLDYEARVLARRQVEMITCRGCGRQRRTK